MNNEEEENVLNKTILDTGIAKPINVSKEEAVLLAKKAEEENKKVVSVTAPNVVAPTPITKEELDEQKINEVNDLMKNDYVKLVEIKHSKKTYIILFLVLALIIGIIIFELIYFGGKL